MKTARFIDAQIMGILRQAESGVLVSELCREHGMSSASFYKWRSKYGATGVQMVRTGELSSCVITHYADAAAAQAAQAKVADLREQAAKEFTMTLTSAYGGDIIGNG